MKNKINSVLGIGTSLWKNELAKMKVSQGRFESSSGVAGLTLGSLWPDGKILVGSYHAIIDPREEILPCFSAHDSSQRNFTFSWLEKTAPEASRISTVRFSPAP